MQSAALGKQVGGRALSYTSVRRGRPPASYGSGRSTTKRYADRMLVDEGRAFGLSSSVLWGNPNYDVRQCAAVARRADVRHAGTRVRLHNGAWCRRPAKVAGWRPRLIVWGGSARPPTRIYLIGRSTS